MDSILQMEINAFSTKVDLLVVTGLVLCLTVVVDVVAVLFRIIQRKLEQ